MGGCGVGRLQEMVLLAFHYHISDSPSLPPKSPVLWAISLSWIQTLGWTLKNTHVTAAVSCCCPPMETIRSLRFEIRVEGS